MATEKQIKDFIGKMAPCAMNGYKALGKVLPSVCIGMACVESGYGTAGSTKYHSYLGQKVGTGKTATKYWGGKFFSTKTKEEYTVGVHTTIKAAFRSYDSMQQCVLNYYELLNTSLYKRVTAGVDYKTQMQQIKACGYMTSSTEVNSVIKIIERYNLTQYDKGIHDAAKTADSVPVEIIKMGSTGEAVEWLQNKLKERGYNLKVDGVAGEKTIDALTDFQVKAFPNDRNAWDGICGPETKKKLLT